jgi:hypothetical protein
MGDQLHTNTFEKLRHYKEIQNNKYIAFLICIWECRRAKKVTEESSERTVKFYFSVVIYLDSFSSYFIFNVA